MSVGQLKIHSENILPIIKKWLYSDKDIFVRELISNATDAIRKLTILRDQGENAAPIKEPRIDVTINRDNRTLTFSDSGLGMTAEEVEKYIAQIAFSSAEEFVQKYQNHSEKDQIIGHFGLGFYSAYMVAEKVDIDTLSYKGGEPAFWSCDGTTGYTLEKGERQEVGTTIILHIAPGEEEYLEESRIREILTRYCVFLPYPIYLNGQRINHKEPLWIKQPNQCTQNDYLEFYRYLYPLEEEPLFWIHLNVDYPFHLKGILYFPRVGKDFDPRRHTLKLFCNRVFVSDDCKDILPEYLMTLRGTIDSPDIPLNVSRSSLQTDRTVRQVAGHISKKVADTLSSLFKNDKDRFIERWPDIEWIVKLGTMEDEKFYERVKDLLIWKNTSDAWVTVEEYLAKNREKTHGKVFYTFDHNQTSLLELYRAKGIDVIYARALIDNHLMSFLERKLDNVHFERIDGGISEALLDLSKEKKILDAEGRTEASRMADFIRSKLSDQSIEVEARSLATTELPAVIVVDEQQRRLRDYLRVRDKQGIDSTYLVKPKFVINTNSGLMSSLQKLEHLDSELVTDVVKELYELALLSQHEMEGAKIQAFVKRSNAVLEKLTERLTQFPAKS